MTLTHREHGSLPSASPLGPLELTTPAISVVIPHWGPVSILSRTLASRVLTESEEVEVIVVDDGNEPPLSSAGLPADPRIRTVRLNRRSGPVVARNVGARAAQGKFLLFLDSGCTPNDAWLRTMYARLEGGAQFCAGPVGIETGDPRALSSLVASTFAYNSGPDGPLYWASTCNLGISRSLFAETGGFASRFVAPGGEDIEFCFRVRALGNELCYVPEAHVSHEPIDGTTTALRKHFRYGRGEALLVGTAERNQLYLTPSFGLFHLARGTAAVVTLLGVLAIRWAGERLRRDGTPRMDDRRVAERALDRLCLAVDGLGKGWQSLRDGSVREAAMSIRPSLLGPSGRDRTVADRVLSLGLEVAALLGAVVWAVS